MQVSVEKTGELQRRMTVQVPAADIESQIDSRLRELRNQVRLKGFRPGKVPMDVVSRRYGKQVREEVLQELMQNRFAQAAEQESLRVAGVTRLEPAAGTGADDFEFVAELEVFPQLESIDLSTIHIEKPAAEVADSDVDDMIQTLREQRRRWQAAGRAAAEGDRVRVEYQARVGDTLVPDLGRHQLAPILGSGALFEAFEQALTGLEAGAEKTVTLTFPEDYREAALAGQAAEVSFKVVAVETSELPMADDEFAASFGVEGGLEAMRADVRRNLVRELRQALTGRIKLAVTDALDERFADLELPASLVRQEAEQMRARVREQSGGNEAPPLEQFTEAAAKRVRMGFLLSEIARQHEIDIDEGRVREQIMDIADTYEHPEQVLELYRGNPRLLEGVRNMVLEEQVVNKVLELATVTEKESSFKEVMGQA